MKVLMLAENLNKGLAIAMKSVASRPQLPVLANVRINAGKELEILATDLEMSFRIKMGAKIEEEGDICVPAKILGEFLATITTGVVELITEGETLKVSSGKIKASFQGLSAGEFPAIPEFTGSAEAVFKAEDLAGAVNRVGFAASKDDSRPVYTGMLWEVREKGIVMAATDGYRLSTAVVTTKEQKKDLDWGKLIIPARVLTELIRAIEKDGKGEVWVKAEKDKQQVIFKYDEVELVSRLLGGDFPPFEQIIPKNHSTKAVFDRNELLEAVRRTSIFARESAHIIKMVVEKDGCVISANSQQLGNSESQIEVPTEGEHLEVAFNSRYLTEFLAVVEEEAVEFESEGSLKPGVFKPADKKSQGEYVHVIMPVRVAP